MDTILGQYMTEIMRRARALTCTWTVIELPEDVYTVRTVTVSLYAVVSCDLIVLERAMVDFCHYFRFTRSAFRAKSEHCRGTSYKVVSVAFGH